MNLGSLVPFRDTEQLEFRVVGILPTLLHLSLSGTFYTPSKPHKASNKPAGEAAK